MKVAAAELCKVYHGVKHHHSYRSVDCGTKIDREVFSDSNIAKNVKCAKTKAHALCENVLAPFSTKSHVDYMVENNLPFSIASDASNKGTTKCFPIMLRYFHFENGVQNVLVDFYSDSNEISEAIANQLLPKVEAAGLKFPNFLHTQQIMQVLTKDNITVSIRS